MNTHSQCLKKVTKGMVAALAGLMLVSCVSTRSSQPEQVAASNPTVTYEYRNDDELIKANQQAITFCNQYQGLPRAQSFAKEGSDRNRVIFECVGASSFSSTTPIRQSSSDLTYNFRTDQELLDVSRDAQIRCMNSAAPEMDSNIAVHSDGSKTVTFRCSQG